MNTIYRGDLRTPAGRRNAWLDSLFVDHALLRLVWRNFAAAIPGRLYRSNHPTPAGLARLVRRHGIRSIVNLRGQCANGSDALSREAANRLGLTFIDAPISSGDPPSRERLLALVEALQTARTPILAHCKSGADRAGFAAAIAALLQGDPSDTARKHLSWRFGHLKNSRAGILDAVLAAYAAEAEGRQDFVSWVRFGYDPATVRRGRTTWFARALNDRVLARE